MGENEITQEQREEMLHKIWWDFTKIMAFFCGGWILISIGMSFDKIPLALLGFAVTGGPIGILLLTGAKLSGLLKPDYEVVRKDGGGNILSSDSGAQSMGNKLIFAIFLAILMLIVGIVIQLIRAIILGVKYIGVYRKLEKKPPFLHNISFVILIGFAVLIGAPIIFGGIGKVQKSIQEAARIKAENTSDYTIAQVRPMLDEIKLQISGQDNRYNYTIYSNRDAYNTAIEVGGDATSAFIEVRSEVSGILSGRYRFENNAFSSYTDMNNEAGNPTQADIQATNSLRAANFIAFINSAKDSDILAKNRTELQRTYVEIVLFKNDPEKEISFKYWPDRSAFVEKEKLQGIRVGRDFFKRFK